MALRQIFETDMEALAALNELQLSGQIEDQLYRYCLLLQEYNLHTNLVANSDLTVLYKEHLLDSLKLLPYLNKGRTKLIDIGSGAGFPGMVLALAMPELKVSLVDSIGKKCRFLESVVEKLELGKRVRVVCQRAEQLGKDPKFREKFDFATARAVGALPVVLELTLPLLSKGGLLLAQRSKRQALEEEQSVQDYSGRLGGQFRETVHFGQDLLGRELSLIVVEKVQPTPRLYPRSAAQMKAKMSKNAN